MKQTKTNHKFPYKWYLKDGYPKWNGCTVFSTFACGGGSTMGYKRAGYKVLGHVDIDGQMIKVYATNHEPKYSFHESMQLFCQRNEFPDDLHSLDILDGSPPCSSFSMAGSREKMWGKSKKFREGQEEQVLDTLFFDFIELARRLKPKVVIAENVKGMLAGSAKEYVKRVYADLDDAGYYVNHWTLNGRHMGLPQARERVFFLCMRKDIADKLPVDKLDIFHGLPYINMAFNEPEVTFGDSCKEYLNDEYKPLTPTPAVFWPKCDQGDSFATIHKESSLFNHIKVAEDRPLPTLTASGGSITYHPTIPRILNEKEWCIGGGYPLDYNSLDVDIKYLIGMSVPPVMTAQIADRIKTYWLDKIKEHGII